MKVDDDTQKALLLFNRRAEAAEAAKATERRLAKATKAKDEAAEALKRAQDSGGGAQAVSEAEATWREAVDTWQRLRDGEEVPEQKATPAGGEPTEEPTPRVLTFRGFLWNPVIFLRGLLEPRILRGFLRDILRGFLTGF